VLPLHPVVLRAHLRGPRCRGPLARRPRGALASLLRATPPGAGGGKMEIRIGGRVGLLALLARAGTGALLAGGIAWGAFGNQGKVVTSIGPVSGADAVAIGRDRKIVVAGSSTISGTFDFATLRYRRNGNLDDSFAGDGSRTDDLGASIRRAPSWRCPAGRSWSAATTPCSTGACSCGSARTAPWTPPSPGMAERSCSSRIPLALMPSPASATARPSPS